MIIGFGDKETKKIFEGKLSKKLPQIIQQRARRKLRMIHASMDVEDLRIPPSNKLERKSGNLKEFWSIKINDQWRIIFKWDNGIATEVQIIDYH